MRRLIFYCQLYIQIPLWKALVAVRNFVSDVRVKIRSPLEILYSDGTRSFSIEKAKTPIAIIVGNIGVALEDACERMNWDKAKAYCDEYSLGGKKWMLPDKEQGHWALLLEHANAIDRILHVYGKARMCGHWYWSSNSASDEAWSLFFFSDENGEHAYNASGTSKRIEYSVRPVCIL